MKLIIQIPCFNEEASLPITIKELPKSLPGVDVLEWLIIDDGSTDRTVEVAKSLGVHHVVRVPNNRGLANAFMAGLRGCLEQGADIIVNTDADNQYQAADIGKLIDPILKHQADMVIGERPIMQTEHFSFVKKILQRIGSLAVRLASRTDVKDAPSGFRALSRSTAMHLKVFSTYTYTLETIIQAGQFGLTVVSVPIRTNGDLRPSRLVRSIPSYVRRSIFTIIRIFIVYRPLRFFALLGGLTFGAGFLIGLRFLYFFLSEQGAPGHTQSLILASLLMTMGFVTVMIGIVADLVSVNRRILEELSFRLWKFESAQSDSRADLVSGKRDR